MIVTAPRVLLVGLLGGAFAPTAPTAPAAPVPVERAKAEKELAALRARLCDSWRGGPCEGDLTLRSDGTYEWIGIGPGGDQHRGTWGLKGEPVQPTLVLECKTADGTDLKGKTVELKLLQVAEAGIRFKEPDEAEPKNFLRAQKEEPRP